MSIDAERYLLGGLLSERGTLAATAGLQVPGVRVARKTQLAPNTFRVELDTALVGVATFRASLNGRDLGLTNERAIIVTVPSGERGPAALSVVDPDQNPELHYPGTLNLEWERVAGAVDYQVHDLAGGLVATVLDDGAQYYQLQTPAIDDGDAYQFDVTARVPDLGVTSSAASVSGTMVTIPEQDPAPVFTYPGSSTFSVG